jgi:predicted secreted protein
MRLFVAFIAAALLAAPAVATAQSLDPAVYGIGAASTPIAEHVGTRFLIALDSNKTTGYSWTAAVRGGAVTNEGSAYQASSGHTMGAPGRQIFVFYATRKGTSTVTLTYRRPWAHSGPAAKTVTFTIVVK